jgi:hypothetical protein
MNNNISKTSQAVKSKILPHRFNLLKPENLQKVEERIFDKWVGYMDGLALKKFALVNHNEKAVKFKKAVWGSRYHERGQWKQKRKIRSALGHYFYKRGVLLTLTFDHKKFSCLWAWSDQGYKVRNFMDRLNKWREGHGLSKIRGFLHVNEDQGKSGYPAPHVVFPGLRYLAPTEVIERPWGYGFIKVNSCGSINPAKYACKYITKMKGKDFMMAMMWWFKVRTYTFSRSFKYKAEDWVNSGWEFLRRNKDEDQSLEDAVSDLRRLGYYIFNIGLLRLKPG